MKQTDYREAADTILDWLDDYHANMRELPVRPDTQYGDTKKHLRQQAPDEAESFEVVFNDFKEQILPGLTHWQHPRFFAYFPANASRASMLAEMLMSGLGINTMLWETSPAATELEEKMVAWLADACGFPDWPGVIQSTASEATLCALLVARDQKGGDFTKHRIYVSGEAHSSIEKACMIVGYPRDAIRLIPTDDALAACPKALEQMIADDVKQGFSPTALVATAGSTSTGAFDSINSLADSAERHGLYIHIDAAWAGSAMVCEEFRPLIAGVERADSLVFNPHKWMGIQFDCSVHYVKHKEKLINSLSVLPEYLKGADTSVTDYRDWGIPLGRRARGIKIWFALRLMGLNAIRQMIRQHVAWTKDLAKLIEKSPDFELTTEPSLSLLSFRYLPSPYKGDLNRLNEQLLHAINRDGFTYLTKTKIGDRLVTRFQIGPMAANWQDIEQSFNRVAELARALSV